MATRKLYFDYAATTPIDPRVARSMEPYFKDRFGNAGSVHSFGQEAIAAVDHARETIGGAIGAGFRELVFTGSATEANNLALRGAVQRFWWDFFLRHGRRATSGRILPHIVTSAIEHESILETVHDIEARGAARVTVLPVAPDGLVDPGAVRGALTRDTILVSVMHANNEIGTVEPIAEIAKIIQGYRVQGIGSRARDKQRDRLYPNPYTLYPLFHTDAVQAFQYLDCGVDALGVDLMTLSAHKIYGPKGVGALYARNWKMVNGKWSKAKNSNYQLQVTNYLSPIITGGGQEFGLRSGTENVPAIVGFAKAVEIAARVRVREAKRVTKLRDRLLHEIQRHVPNAAVNGSLSNRLPNNVHVRVPGRRGEEIATALDLRGIAVATGPACAARSAKPSHVLQAIGLSERAARECVRITLGRRTLKRDVDQLLAICIKLFRSP